MTARLGHIHRSGNARGGCGCWPRGQTQAAGIKSSSALRIIGFLLLNAVLLKSQLEAECSMLGTVPVMPACVALRRWSATF
jgi:hypothetical protein